MGSTIYNAKQLALIIHHRLVKIHLFPKGNGRHARLAADCILKKLDSTKKIDWEGKNFRSAESLRKKYISALRSSDKGDYRELFELFEA